MLQDVGTERAVLAGLCQHGLDAYVDVEGLVKTTTFTLLDNQVIYKALQEIFSRGTKNVDIPMLLSELKALNFEYERDVKKLELIRSLFNHPIHLENVNKFALKIINLQIGRSLQNKHQESIKLLNEVTGNEGIDHLLSISETPVLSLMQELSSDSNKPKKIGEDIDGFLQNKFDNPIDCIGIPTPFPLYNSIIGGGIRTGVTLIGARPKTGKSTFAKETAYYVAKNYSFPVLYLDTEMDSRDQLNRMISGLAKVQIQKVETGKCNEIEKEKIYRSVNQIKTLPFFHKRIAGKEFPEVLSIIRRWIHQEVGFDASGKTNRHLIIYDYFKLMSSKTLEDMQEYQALGFQISALSDFCGQYDSPVLAFVQLNRDGITNDTTAAVSQSDRLVWLCTSFSLFKRKNAEEIAADGPENGNMKLIPIECRFGKPMDGNYINMNMRGEFSILSELSTQKQAVDEGRKDNGSKRREPNRDDMDEFNRESDR